MINRVLIRIKVVQLLYSYLLTRSEFKMPKPVENPSRDKAFAFSVYHDILSFLLSISVREGRTELPGLAHNKFLIALANDEGVRAQLRNYSNGVEGLMTSRASVIDGIKDLKEYKTYIRKRKLILADDTELLKTIVENVLMKSESFHNAVRTLNGFTGNGLDRAYSMILETIDSFTDSTDGLSEARAALSRSLDKAYELYFSLLLLIPELTRMQALKLDAAKHKHLPTVEDLNPNMKFVENKLAAMIDKAAENSDFLKTNSISWVVNNPELLRRLLNSILESDIYSEYMSTAPSDLKEDCEFWKNILKKVIFTSDDLAEALESMSVYWNDDLTVMDSFVLKTIKRAATDGEFVFLPKYKDDVDAAFGAELFDFAIENREEYRSLINRFIDQKQWDTERLAFMDIVIMLIAIAELINYPAIPIPVTVNEYVEIANCYSTPRSGHFINGILNSVIGYLKNEGVLNKS